RRRPDRSGGAEPRGRRAERLDRQGRGRGRRDAGQRQHLRRLHGHAPDAGHVSQEGKTLRLVIFSPYLLAFYASWAVTGLGVGLWIWSWVRVKDPIGRLRFQDCGVVLVFAAVLTRIIIQDREMTVFDWAMI